MKKTLNQLEFDNSFTRLGKGFYSRHKSKPLKNQCLIHFNDSFADEIELDPQLENIDEFIKKITSSNEITGFDSIAQCYAGHQFGHFVPRLGDGRAMLMAEFITSKNQRWDIQLKGAGPTEYSRGSDGRAVLRSSIREYLCSEAMHGLGIGSTRALCLIGSDSEVYREQIEAGAIVVRLAQSHIRFGSFEYYYYSNQYAELKQLTDYVLDTHFPALKNEKNPYLALLKNVIHSTAHLIAQWQGVGFCHGVMNTDNMSIHGITLDYGPFGFLDAFDDNFICNHSDHQGRYAYNKQAEIGLFNLSCFAQTLLPLIDADAEKSAQLAKQCLTEYQFIYIDAYAQIMRNKLGFVSEQKQDQEICKQLFKILHQQKIDFTIFFRQLSQIDQTQLRNLFVDREVFDQWFDTYSQRLLIDNVSDSERSIQQRKANPKYILRNYLAEQAIKKAEKGDFSEIDTLFKILQSPFEEHSEFEQYASFPPEWASQISVSCSS